MGRRRTGEVTVRWEEPSYTPKVCRRCHDGRLWAPKAKVGLCLDCLVEEWHTGAWWGTDVPLHTYLGLTWRQYQRLGGGDGQADVMPRVVIIDAMFSSLCDFCDGRIEAGERIMRVDVYGWVHVSCGERFQADRNGL